MSTPYVHEYLRAIDHPLRLLGETFRAEYDFLVAQLSKKNIVLDVGCGAGRPSKDLAPFCEKIVCLDNDKEMLSFAMQRSAGVSNIAFEFGEATAMDFPNDAFDFVFATYNLIGSISSDERSRMVSEMFRVTKKGGKVFLVTWKDDSATTDFLKKYYPSIGISILSINNERTVTNKGTFDRISLNDLKKFLLDAGVKNIQEIELDPVWFGVLGVKE
jgi:ubiquinone/menaquinone biosynthesis C-methylase UbiE